MNEAQVRHRCADLETERDLANKNYEQVVKQLDQVGKLQMENAKLKAELEIARESLLAKYEFELSIFNNPADQVVEYHLTWKMNDYEMSFLNQQRKVITALSNAINHAVIDDFVNNQMGRKETTRVRRLKLI